MYQFVCSIKCPHSSLTTSSSICFLFFHRQKWIKKDPGCKWQADPSENGVFGKNYCNTLLKRYGKMLGLADPETCTAHGYRKMGTSRIVNTDGIGPKLAKQLTRQKNYDVLACYEKPDTKAMDRATEALQGKDALEECMIVERPCSIAGSGSRTGNSNSFNYSPIPQQSFGATPESTFSNPVGQLGFMTQEQMQTSWNRNSPTGLSISVAARSNQSPCPPPPPPPPRTSGSFTTPLRGNSFNRGSFNGDYYHRDHSDGPSGPSK
jgi:hypothetical protein